MDHFHQPQPMTKPIIISVLFHALVIALFVLGIPFFGKQYLAKKPQFTVNLVYEGAQNPFGSPLPQKEETSLPVKSEPIPQAMPSPAPPPQNDQKNNAAKSAIVPPPPPQSQKTAPAPTPAPLPKTPEKKTLSRQDLLRELEKAMDKNKSPKTPDVKKEKTEDKNPPTKAVQPPSKNDQKITAPAPTQPDQLAELMKAMDRTKASSDTPSKKKRASQAASNGTLPTSNNIANPTQSTALGLIDLDSVRRVVEPCWHVDAGMLNASQLQVELRLTISRDAIVEKAEIVDTARYKTDRYYRAAADAARRAVENPNCRQFPLPKDRYDDWHVSVFTFDPKDIGR